MENGHLSIPFLNTNAYHRASIFMLLTDAITAGHGCSCIYVTSASLLGSSCMIHMHALQSVQNIHD
jgi:hypothetical protein